MSVKYILSRVGSKMGMDMNDPQERSVLLAFLNEAAPELYNQFDMAGSLMEQVFRINGDQTITLPAYVGRIRSIRKYDSQSTVHLNQMRPRYNQFNWLDTWNNYRLKNKQCLMASVVNESIAIITVPEVENPPIVISLVGSTSVASRINEDIVMDAVTKQSTNNFTDYVSVTKDRVNSFDVRLTDVDNKLLTIIPNNELIAQYQIVDVSQGPWLSQTSDVMANYVEVLYKKKLSYLQNDSDEFPAFDYDDILVNKIMQLWAEEQEKSDMATAYDNKATRSAARLHEEQNRGTEDMVSLVSNPHDTILRRIGSGLRRRYGRFVGRTR